MKGGRSMDSDYKISAADYKKIRALQRKVDPNLTDRGSWKYAVDMWLIRTGQMPNYKPPKGWKDPYIEYGIVKPAKRRAAKKR